MLTSGGSGRGHFGLVHRVALDLDVGRLLGNVGLHLHQLGPVLALLDVFKVAKFSYLCLGGTFFFMMIKAV